MMETEKNNLVSEPIATGQIANRVNRFVSKEQLPAYLSAVKTDDIPLAISFLVDKLAARPTQSGNRENHQWDSYELSPEIAALSSFERVPLPSDYDATLIKIVKEENA